MRIDADTNVWSRDRTVDGEGGRLLLWGIIGQLPRVSGEDPKRIRVDSVVETSVCLSVCSLFFVCKFSHFSLFHSSLFIQYSTEECSTVQLFIYKIIAVMIDIDTS